MNLSLVDPDDPSLSSFFKITLLTVGGSLRLSSVDTINTKLLSSSPDRAVLVGRGMYIQTFLQNKVFFSPSSGFSIQSKQHGQVTFVVQKVDPVLTTELSTASTFSIRVLVAQVDYPPTLAAPATLRGREDEPLLLANVSIGDANDISQGGYSVHVTAMRGDLLVLAQPADTRIAYSRDAHDLRFRCASVSACNAALGRSSRTVLTNCQHEHAHVLIHSHFNHMC